ncbi:MAG: hypothetical protein BA874_01870 [Desulfuromonadales bacterium C00003068]|jgi:general secretion pathway protein L|nr:MAG: hypothetical protein BA874_01870 [Desulfuromonadales bacterium C00003068]
MMKRRVGIEITQQYIRMAIFDDEKENPTLIKHAECAIDDSSNIGNVLLEMLGSRPGFADRTCSTLATGGFVRQLSFPFRDARKIAAAARMELTAQLPSDISDHIIATTAALASEGDAMITAATATTEQVSEALQPFEDSQFPLHVLGLSPYTEVSGIKSWFANGILIQLHQNQLLISLIQHGEVVSFEACGQIHDAEIQDTNTLVGRLHREISMICRSARVSNQPLCLMGDGITQELNKALTERDYELIELPLRANNQVIDAAFLPVCAKALAANQPTINFRTGPFTLKSEWAAIKKHLYTGAALLVTALIISGATAIRTYQHKTDVAESYRKQMTQIFRKTLPNTRAIVNIPMQLKSALQQLQTTSALMGIDKSTSALSVLREFSTHTPTDLKVDIKNFNLEEVTLIVDGETNSFDSINRLASELQQSAIFTKVDIADAKTSIDGQSVNFRLQIAIGHQGGQS